MNIVSSFDLGYEGFSKANTETLEALSKALTAGSGVDAASFTNGRAMTPESLDSVLVSVLHTTEEARLFQRLKKNPVKSVVHQWNYRDEVGADYGTWVAEGGSSVSTDQNIARKYITAKYLQIKRQITLQAATSDMLEDAVAIEQEAGALQLIRIVERTLFEGNSTNNTYEPDGIYSQVLAGASSNILDMRGADATSAAFENNMNLAAQTIRGHFGVATHMFSSISVMSDVQQLLRDRIRFPAGGTMGSAVFNEYPTPFGKFELIDDVFINEGTVAAASSVSGIPGTTTTMVLGSPSTNSDALSQFSASDVGVYYYKIAPTNQYGPGSAIASSSVTSVAGYNVSIGVSTYPVPVATSFKVYRSKKGAASGADARYAFTVSQAAVVAATNAIIDENAYLPGTSTVSILNLNPAYNAAEWIQFLPMMRFDLYPTDAATYPFLMLLFGALALKKPTQHVLIKNVSPSGLGWY